MNGTLVQLHSLYPDLVDEACFIDRDGPEQARMVKGQIAETADLSPDESEAPFFAPTFALSAGKVHQHGPYVSEDSKRWVISNSTPVYLALQGRGVVTFRGQPGGGPSAAVREPGQGERAQVIESSTGLIVMDAGS